MTVEQRYAVVIPARNESATIADVAARATAVARTVIVVDDGSTDGTHECLAGLQVLAVDVRERGVLGGRGVRERDPGVRPRPHREA